MSKSFRFITVFLLLVIGPIIYNLVSAFVTIDNISQKDKNLIGLIGAMAYFIGLLATRLFIFIEQKGFGNR